MALVVGQNSYVSVAEADAFFLDLFIINPEVKTWGDATNADKEKALITATRRMDALPLVGRKADPVQALEFPRAFLTAEGVRQGWEDPEPGVYVETGVLPNVKRACMEEALATLAGVEEPNRVKLQRQGVTSAKIGSTSETFSGTGALRPALLSEAAAGYLRPYLKSAAAFG